MSDIANIAFARNVLLIRYMLYVLMSLGLFQAPSKKTKVIRNKFLLINAVEFERCLIMGILLAKRSASGCDIAVRMLWASLLGNALNHRSSTIVMGTLWRVATKFCLPLPLRSGTTTSTHCRSTALGKLGSVHSSGNSRHSSGTLSSRSFLRTPPS